MSRNALTNHIETNVNISVLETRNLSSMEIGLLAIFSYLATQLPNQVARTASKFGRKKKQNKCDRSQNENRKTVKSNNSLVVSVFEANIPFFVT